MLGEQHRECGMGEIISAIFQNRLTYCQRVCYSLLEEADYQQCYKHLNGCLDWQSIKTGQISGCIDSYKGRNIKRDRWHLPGRLTRRALSRLNLSRISINSCNRNFRMSEAIIYIALTRLPLRRLAPG